MKEIINRLHENRQIQLAKEILESSGYSVEKIDENVMTIRVLSGVNADGCDITISNDLHSQDYRYGYNASYSKERASQDKPFIGDIINDLCKKYDIKKSSIVYERGKNVFTGNDISDESVARFKKNYVDSVKESVTLNESMYTMMDAIDSAQVIMKGSDIDEFEKILADCGASEDDSDPDIGYFAGMTDEQINTAYNRVRELVKKVIKKMSPMEINDRFFGYGAGGRDILDAFGLNLNQKGELMESSEYDEDSPDDQILFDAIGTKVVDTLFPQVQFNGDETEKLDAAIDMLVWIHKNLKSRDAI